MYIFPTTLHTVSDDFADHVARGSVNPGTDYQTVDSDGWHKPVYAVADGVVEVVSNGIAGSGGRYVQYNVGGGVVFQDLHLSKILVTQGQHVKQGDQIAVSGASAYGSETGTGGPHLHHAMKLNGRNVDFETFLDLGNIVASIGVAIATKKGKTMKLLNVTNWEGGSASAKVLIEEGKPDVVVDDGIATIVGVYYTEQDSTKLESISYGEYAAVKAKRGA